MSKRVAILQSNYIPWKGYFDLINSVDDFVIYDTVQFTARDWRNRNRIKTPAGLTWLTIPVRHVHRHQLIQQTVVDNPRWAEKHWKSLSQNYSNVACIRQYGPLFQKIYEQAEQETYLSAINYLFMSTICNLLGIGTRLSWSSSYTLVPGRTERLVDLCLQLNATEYVSGPAARDYINADLFSSAGIKLTYIDYSGYMEYRQPFGSFEHAVSIVDLIFNEGANAPSFMKSFHPHSSGNTGEVPA